MKTYPIVEDFKKLISKKDRSTKLRALKMLDSMTSKAQYICFEYMIKNNIELRKIYGEE